MPGALDRIAHARFLPELVAVSRLDRPGVDRPDVTETGVPGLLVAGDWTQGGPWIADAAIGAGRRAAEAVLAARAARRAA